MFGPSSDIQSTSEAGPAQLFGTNMLMHVIIETQVLTLKIQVANPNFKAAAAYHPNVTVLR